MNIDKIKKIAKYTTNGLAIISALIFGINSVEGITIPYATQIIEIIAVLQGIIGTYLLGQKAVNSNEVKTQINIETLEELENGVDEDEI